ncbi:MAG: vWA domain-containing protein [Anaerolineae bacterium]
MGMGQERTDDSVQVVLAMHPERRLIRPSGSRRHVYLRLRVEESPPRPALERAALNLALVIDRSGSMSGDKLATAKRAALSVIERLSERDRVAVVIYDDRIDVLQPAAPATPAVKSAIRKALGSVEARASTALHEGWLTGCRAIASDRSTPAAGPARCFLLTDGLANVGLTDPEAIASAAAQVREHAGVGTSTFGIGADYDENLLGPMAVAGGGQFHHLRSAHEIASTFVGELGELLAVAAGQVHLEVELRQDMHAEVVSAYWGEPADMGFRVAVGDLLAGEERHIVLRLAFPPGPLGAVQVVRARPVWLADGARLAGPWSEVAFTYASHAECDAEARDRTVMHWVGLHHAERARNEAIKRNRMGDLQAAREVVHRTREHLACYAQGDPELEEALRELEGLETQVAASPLASLHAKEERYAAYLRSRSQRDHRGS